MITQFPLFIAALVKTFSSSDSYVCTNWINVKEILSQDFIVSVIFDISPFSFVQVSFNFYLCSKLKISRNFPLMLNSD